jgi:hypothetical protein
MYEEAGPYYQQMQAHASALQSLLSGAALDAAACAALTPQGASAMAAAVTAQQAAASRQVAAAQQALAASAAAAAGMEAHLHSRAAAVLAAAIVQVLLCKMLLTSANSDHTRKVGSSGTGLHGPKACKMRRACVEDLGHAGRQAGHVPGKLNAVIQPLMGALRREADPLLRSATADALAQLAALCAARTPSPNDRCTPDAFAFIIILSVVTC